MANEDLALTKTKGHKLWDAIKAAAPPLKSLLSVLEPYLVSTKDVVQLRATKVLVKALHRRKELSWTLIAPELCSLLEFFAGIIKEPLCGVYGIKGISLVLEAFPENLSGELYESTMRLLDGLQVNAYSEKGRRQILAVYVQAYEKTGGGKNKDERYVLSWLKAFKGENSHVNVKLMLEHMLNMLQALPSEVIQKTAEGMFKLATMYFPVRIARTGKQFADLQKTLTTLLIDCLTSHQAFAQYLFPYLIEKLKSLSVDTVLDTLFVLQTAVKKLDLKASADSVAQLNMGLRLLVKDNINPDILTLAVEVQVALWQVSLSYHTKQFKTSLAAYFADIKGNTETPSSIIIRKALESSSELCSAVLLHGVIEHMEIFMACADGIQKSVLLRCVTRTFYDCSMRILQEPATTDKSTAIRSNRAIVDGFCKEVLFGACQFDRYDILLVSYIQFFVHALVLQKPVPEHDKTLQFLLDVLKSRLIEEKRFQEVAAAFLSILPNESLSKSMSLGTYLDSSLHSLTELHHSLLAGKPAKLDQFLLRVFASVSRFPKYFKLFVDTILEFLAKSAAVPHFSAQQTEWIGNLMDVFTETVLASLGAEPAGSEAEKALHKFVVDLPREFRCPLVEWKKLEDKYLKSIVAISQNSGASRIPDTLYNSVLRSVLALDRGNTLQLRLLLKVTIALSGSLSKTLLCAEETQKDLLRLVQTEIHGKGQWLHKLAELVFRMLALANASETSDRIVENYRSVLGAIFSPPACLLKLLLAFGAAVILQLTQEQNGNVRIAEEWIGQVLEYGAKDNSEEHVEESVRFWKKSMRVYSLYADAKSVAKKVKEMVAELRRKRPEAHILTLLTFLLEPETGPESIQAYSREALAAIRGLPDEVKKKDYVLPTLCFIISAEGTQKTICELIPILIHIVKAGKLKTRLKALGVLLALLRKETMLTPDVRELVLGECKALLADPKRSVRTFVRACLNAIYSSA